MTDQRNVFHIKSKQPLDLHMAEEAKAMTQEIEREDEAVLEDRNNCIELLDSARQLVESGRLTGLIVIGLDPMTDLFLNEIRLAGPSVGREAMFSYIGMLDTLKAELMEAALMAPVINTKGAIVDPYDTIEDYDEDEE